MKGDFIRSRFRGFGLSVIVIRISLVTGLIVIGKLIK